MPYLNLLIIQQFLIKYFWYIHLEQNILDNNKK